jgi:UDP-N-acetylmuramoyl-tripeptide--D-alanyl-D-alanine ligase
LRTMGPGDAALVKGSRVARLEDVVRAYGEAEGAPSLTPGAGAGAAAAA